MSDLLDERTQELIAEFRQRYGAEPTTVASGPGRVNLIGEHTDYNDGFVLPVALQRDVRYVFRPRTDRLVRVHSVEFGESFDFDLDAIAHNDAMLWTNYVMGVAWSLAEQGLTLTGIDAVMSGNVPRGSGLSSSAALEVATAHAFLAASGQLGVLDGATIARVAQRAENDFVGVNCGIMDQFISVLGAENHALLIDCRSLTYELVPMPAEAALVIGNTR
ncbi:MAG: galactokinase, partial [Caldilineaceae bacterium]|nr:galactokinase [Caldilineaceae bacterium]